MYCAVNHHLRIHLNKVLQFTLSDIDSAICVSNTWLVLNMFSLWLYQHCADCGHWLSGYRQYSSLRAHAVSVVHAVLYLISFV
jgi:hypothetical protein